MKITIETDGADASSNATMTTASDATATIFGNSDGGAGPSGFGSTGGMAMGDDSDGGVPPQSLLDSIAAAEAAEQSPGQSNAGSENDAGAGPASA